MGIMFCKKQLREVIVVFKKVFVGDEVWLKVLDELELLNEFEEDFDLFDVYFDCEKDEGDNDEVVVMKYVFRDIVFFSVFMQQVEEFVSIVNFCNYNLFF